MSKVNKDAYVGQSLPRPEDRRFIQGAATYIDDVELPGMLFAAFVRSPYAHARIKAVHTRAALEHPKGLYVLTGAEAMAELSSMPVYSYEPAQKIEKPLYPCLAGERVRFMNEPVAVVAAADRYSADDVAELVEVDYEPLPVITDPEASMKPSAVKLHDNLDSNIGLHIVRQGGDIKAAFAEADGVLRKRFRMHRHTGCSDRAPRNRCELQSWSKLADGVCFDPDPAHFEDTFVRNSEFSGIGNPRDCARSRRRLRQQASGRPGICCGVSPVDEAGPSG